MKNATITALLLLPTLSACSLVPDDVQDEIDADRAKKKQELIDSQLDEGKITLKDGRTIVCVLYNERDYPAGGLSCDWENAQAPTP